MKTKVIPEQRINVYSFNELSESAKQKVLNDLWDINVQYEWWEGTHEDAMNIGLKITSFELDRGGYCNGEFTNGACYTAGKILENHGEHCETYKTALTFQAERDEIVNTAPKDEDGEFEDERELDLKLDDCENEFLKSLLEDYRIILTKEYEYLTSKEQIIETIEANEYTFTEDGKMENI